MLKRIMCLVRGHKPDTRSIKTETEGDFYLMTATGNDSEGYHVLPCSRCQLLVAVPLPLHRMNFHAGTALSATPASGRHND